MRRNLLIGVGLLLCACIAIGGASAAKGGKTPTPTRGQVAAVSTVQATNTPVRTPTTQPTATTRPPTAGATVAPTPTPRPAAPPAPTVAAASAAPVAYRSGGFGKTRAEWEAVYQKPEKQSGDIYTYANGNYIVLYYGDRVWQIEHSWGDANAKSFDFAVAAAKPFLPSDGKLLNTYKSRSGSTVEHFHSDSLATVFTPDAFTGATPGDFIVIYRDITGKVTGFVIGLGNNP